MIIRKLIVVWALYKHRVIEAMTFLSIYIYKEKKSENVFQKLFGN